MSGWRWHSGNRVRLLENGEEYFPRVFEAIGQAQREVIIETFILFEDGVGRRLEEAVIAAARRGVRVDITVDGYGSADLSPRFAAALAQAGVRLHVFEPIVRLLGWRTGLFRRLHRKIVVIDGALAFVGGINFAHDHLAEAGEESKQDYAVEVEGPVVADIYRLVAPGRAPRPLPWWRRWLLAHSRAPIEAPVVGAVEAMLAQRDNHHHRTDIERAYRLGVRLARRSVIIANAYFFPGYRLLRDLRNAARRGVRVQLIMQGKPDMPWVRWLSTSFYGYLARGGVEIYEYCQRPIHAKVAVIDDEWATVGSSNLDPLSLSLNLEANLVLRNREFSLQLRQRLERLMSESCTRLEQAQFRRRGPFWQLVTVLAFHAARRFPAVAGWLPAHRPVRTMLTGEGLAVPTQRKAA
ncbi:MAG TPA: cardiolipin synthase ClsB [Nevskiaceae bacterium]|nr:cardiolipin synthase ClsB [Nevskiaceae bacterium]